MNSHPTTLAKAPFPHATPPDTTPSDAAAEEHIIPWSVLYAEEYIAAAGMLIIVGSVVWGVVTRYLLAEPAEWVTEMSAIAFAWTVFIGAAAVFARGEHSAVDLFTAMCPPHLRRVIQALADIAVLATLAAVAFIAIRFTIATTDVATNMLRLPQSTIYGAAATGFSLMAVRHSLFAIRRFLGAR